MICGSVRGMPTQVEHAAPYHPAVIRQSICQDEP